MSGILVQRLAELNLIRDPASAGTKTLVISRHRKPNRRHQYLAADDVLFPTKEVGLLKGSERGNGAAPKAKGNGANLDPLIRRGSLQRTLGEEGCAGVEAGKVRLQPRRASLQKQFECQEEKREGNGANRNCVRRRNAASESKDATVNGVALTNSICGRDGSGLTRDTSPKNGLLTSGSPKNGFLTADRASDLNNFLHRTDHGLRNGVVDFILKGNRNVSAGEDSFDSCSNRNDVPVSRSITVVRRGNTSEFKMTSNEFTRNDRFLNNNSVEGGYLESGNENNVSMAEDSFPVNGCFEDQMPSSAIDESYSELPVPRTTEHVPSDFSSGFPGVDLKCQPPASGDDDKEAMSENRVGKRRTVENDSTGSRRRHGRRDRLSSTSETKSKRTKRRENSALSGGIRESNLSLDVVCSSGSYPVEAPSNPPLMDVTETCPSTEASLDLPGLPRTPLDHSTDTSGSEDGDTDQETDRLLGQQRADDPGYGGPDKDKETTKKKGRSKEVMVHEPAVLIEGVLFRARYLGSTQLVSEGQPTKTTRMMQAEEAVTRIKALAPEGESQPNTEVDLFISTEKIMVLNTDLKEIMMDHALRTISYIADIGDLVVLMARRRMLPTDDPNSLQKQPKMICHVFESDEAQFIAQSIGQAFQVAYLEFLKANGIEDHSFVKEMDYQEVLNSQEIFGDELQMFAKKELQKEVVVPKMKSEILGVVVVESGWGSMVPTVVIANLSPYGAAAKCGQLNIGDQIIAINGVSLVGLPLSTCQNYIKNTKYNTAVKLTVVPCPPVVEVKIRRPDTKYQLGFSVQNGVICSLLRGGIAERGGVRVGHRIIDINSQSVVAVPHEKIVNLLATSVGEIRMKTMPTSIFRLLTGQETPQYI